MKKQSSWDKLKQKSTYHFDSTIADQKNDVITELGSIQTDFSQDVEAIVQDSRPANWETRGFKGEATDVPRPELEEEEYDIERVGADPKMIITNLAWKLSDRLQKIADAFALEDQMNRIHVQMPGQVWNLHIDKLYKWFPSDPDRVGRYFIQLTDWEMGQFWQYGTYNWSHWQAGSVTTFDWENIPHSTANAGFSSRVTLQLTGIITNKTVAFLKELKKQPFVIE
jgi:hypothetical protein